MIRYVLRTMAGPWVALLALAFQAGVLLMDGMPWRGDIMWTAGLLGTSLHLVLPIAAGAVAYDTASVHHPGRLHLVALSRRSRRAQLLPLLVTVVPLMAVYLTLWATSMGLTLRGDHDFPLTSSAFSPVLVHLSAIAFAGALGSVIGRLLPPLIAGAAGGAAMFIATYVVEWFWSGEGVLLLRFYGGAATMLGWSYEWQHALVRTAILIALAAALLLVPVRITHGRVRPTPMTGAVAAVVLAVTIVPLPLALHEYTPVAGVPSDCRGADPVICGFAEQHVLTDVAEPILRDLTDAARGSGYEALSPDRILVTAAPDPALSPRQEGVRYITTYLLYDLRQPELRAPDYIAGELLAPLHCPQLYSPLPPGDVYSEDSENLIGTWLELIGVEHPVPFTSLSPHEVVDILARRDACDIETAQLG